MRWAVAVVMMLSLAYSPAALACLFPHPDFFKTFPVLPLNTNEPFRIGALFGIQTHVPTNTRSMHNGLDLIVPTGTPVNATSSGRVVVADYHHVIGNTVVIDHGNTWETRYQHLADLKVRAGDCVYITQVIGTAGTTGSDFHANSLVRRSNGKVTILHYEVLHLGKHRDPLTLWKTYARGIIRAKTTSPQWHGAPY